MNYDIMIKGEKNIKSINLILSDYYKTYDLQIYAWLKQYL